MTRLDIAAIVLAAVLVLTIAGSFFPQEPEALATDPSVRQLWTNALESRYGASLDFLTALGVFHFARSPIFLVMVGILFVLTLLCSVKRWRSIWRKAWVKSVNTDRAIIDAGPLARSLRTPQGCDGFTALAVELRRRHYRVRQDTRGQFGFLQAEANQKSQLGSILTHIALLLLFAAATVTSLYATTTFLSIGPGEVAGVGENTGWTIRNEDFEVLYNRDGSPSSYEAVITPYDHSVRQVSRLLHVNEPMRVGAYTLYLSSYWGSAGSYGVVLIVARDPGFLAFLIAGLLLVLGICVSLFFPHRIVWAYAGNEGSLHVAGSGSRYTAGFEEHYEAILETVSANSSPRLASGAAQR
ncbi:MAG: cytochrome c biogenesis protein ResB [Anaerolineae bacterium]